MVRRKDDGDYISNGQRVTYSKWNEQQTGITLKLLEWSVADCVNNIERHGDRIRVVKLMAESELKTCADGKRGTGLASLYSCMIVVYIGSTLKCG